MKKVLIAVLAASVILLAGCGSNDDPAQNQNGGKTVEPAATLTVDGLDDAAFPAEFDKTALSEENGAFKLNVTAYEEELFDAVEITTLAEGDTVVAGGQEYKVSSVEESDTGLISVNGGEEQGGVDFATDDEQGGTYYVEGMDDTHTYREVGTKDLPLAENFIFTDDSDQDNPGQTYDADAFKKLLADDTDFYGFNRNNTTVTAENGEITAIHRIFQP